MKLVRHLLVVAALTFGLVANVFAAECANPVAKIGSFDFLVDYSGSMMMRPGIGKTPKMGVIKQVLTKVNNEIPALSYTGALHTFAPYSEVVAPQTFNRAALGDGINKLAADKEIFGRLTPMGEGLEDIAPVLSRMSAPKALILVSDGRQNEGINAIEEMNRIYASDPNLQVHIISIADTPEGKATLDAIHAIKGNGAYVQAKDLLNDDAAVAKFVSEVFYNCPIAATDDAIVLQSVQFALNSAVLTPASKAILDEAANLIKERPGKVEVAGYTCYLGTDAYNMGLSERRADAVKKYLESCGVPANRLVVKGYGKTHPKYDNLNPETRPLNRRVELSFLN